MIARRSAAARRLLRLAVLVIPLAACAPSASGGVRGATAFAATARVERHDSARPVADVAGCFRATATFPPESRFAAGPDGALRYVFAARGRWFEDMVFTAAGAGSHVEVRTSGAYDAARVTKLVRDRLEPLGACLALHRPVAGE